MAYPKKYHVRQVRTEYGWSIVNDETGARVRIYVRSRGKCDLLQEGHDIEYFDTVAHAKHAAYQKVDGVPAIVAKRLRATGAQS